PLAPTPSISTPFPYTTLFRSLLQERLGPSFDQSLSGGTHEPPPFDARSEDHEVHVHRHLLWDASFAVRCQRRAVDKRRRSGRRLDRKSTRLNSSHQIISYAVF